MAKCGGCGKFMAMSEGVRCTKCPGAYHPACIGVTSTKVSPNWLCPACKAKIPRTDNSATPVKSPSDGSLVSSHPNITQQNSNRQPGTSPTATTIQSATIIQPATIQPTTTIQPATIQPTATQPPQILPAPASHSITPKEQIAQPQPQELNVAYEIRCFREELSAMRVELRQFRDEMASLKSDVGLCRERMEVVEGKVSYLEKRFEEKEPSSYDHLEETIAELKLQLNERDQELLINDVIITGIPETKDESPLHILKVVSLKLGVNIDEREIVNAERVGMVRRNFTSASTGSVDIAEPRPRALAVRLSRRAVRDQLLKAARVRRGLTTADLELHGPSQRFYLNERLTPINGKLFYNAREAGQRHKFKYVWTKEGRIYVKREDGVPAQRIRSDLDLSRIFGNASF